MPTSHTETEAGQTVGPAQPGKPPGPTYGLTFVDSSFVLTSLFRQIRELRREPKITIPAQYYQGEAKLPLTDLAGWLRDLPEQIRSLFEEPPVPAIPITSTPVEVPEIWRDYLQQPASWLNSVLVHIVVLIALLLPFYLFGLHKPVQVAQQVVPVDISPYLPQLQASVKKSGGGGGGGVREPSPPSKGALPKFSKVQLAPPVTKILIPKPKLPVQPTLLGPPQLKLPQMATNINWGDPQAAPAPSSNGPGTGGGIGTGNGTGIGSGTGGGAGPGTGGGVGGGVYSVGGNVTEPIAIYEPDPPYSEQARKAKFQGTVVLAIIIDAQGDVRDEQIIKALGLGLDEEAMKTVRTWKFKPAMRNGVPVPVRVTVEISFRLF
ncbi:MAG: energy transducer TonB [Terriglobia bacterium]